MVAANPRHPKENVHRVIMLLRHFLGEFGLIFNKIFARLRRRFSRYCFHRIDCEGAPGEGGREPVQPTPPFFATSAAMRRYVPARKKKSVSERPHIGL